MPNYSKTGVDYLGRGDGINPSRSTEAPPKVRMNIGFMAEGQYYIRCGEGEESTMVIMEDDSVNVYDCPIETYQFVWSQVTQIHPIFIEV